MNQAKFLELYNNGEESIEELLDFFDTNFIGKMQEIVKRNKCEDLKIVDDFDLLDGFTYSINVFGKLVTLEIVDSAKERKVDFRFPIQYIDSFDEFVLSIVFKAYLKEKHPEKFERYSKKWDNVAKEKMYEKLIPDFD